MENVENFKLKKELERLKIAVRKQRYGLVWLDIPEAFEDDVENKLPILKEAPELAIKNNDGKPTHILIEGDNYHALTCLNYTHKGKIDLIYIDPPYNTGSDGFRYKDKRVVDRFPDGAEVPQDHPFRHSYWLSFMRKRLELAKDLLRDTGVIFISIDINELAQLKLLADEIFSEKNLISLITVKVKDPAGVGQQSYVFDVCEYVLMYAKNLIQFKNSIVDLPMDYEQLNEQYGSYNKVALDFGKSKLIKEITRQNVGKIKIYQCQDSRIGKTNKLSFKEYIKNRAKIFADYNPNGGMILAIKDEIPKKGLSYIEYTPTKGRDEGEVTKVYFLNGRIIAWLANVVSYENGKIYKKTKMTNVWNTPNAALYLEGGVDFTNGKKPIKLIKKLLNLMKTPNAKILDFFAGSGTTGEAVMSLNQDDEGNRQFILVTNNDEVINGKKNKIMSDICYPRMQNVMLGKKGITKLGNSLKYYKTAFIGKNNILNAVDEDKVELAHNAGELLAIAENTLELIKQNRYYQLFENTNKRSFTAVYFREELDRFQEFIAMVGKIDKKISIYIFSWGEEEFADDFSHLKNASVKTIPQPILEIYKNIYNLSV